MKRELLSKAIGDIDESFVAEAYRPVESAAGSPERIVHMKKKRIISFALAAVLLLALGAAAYAVNQAVGTPQAAERVALQEIEVWKQMGLLNPEVRFEGSASKIVELQEEQGSESYWYGRLFKHHYDVRWYLGPVDQFWGDQTPPPELVRRDYGCNLSIDTLSGKITAVTIDARSDPNAEPVWEDALREPVDPENPKAGAVEIRPLYFYDNFEDIFPADMTVDRFCTLLAEYWGFSGYRLAETVDGTYFDEPREPVDPDSLLKDMIASPLDNYYLTVFFEGDQPGVPMYIQLHEFPGYVTLMVGTGHAVG